MSRCFVLAGLILAAIGCGRGSAGPSAAAPLPAREVRVAVAANFTAPMQVLAAEFEKTTGCRAKLSFGSTGALGAQIRQGAPFDVLLAADEATPARLEAENAAVPGSRFTYAIGRLVLWSPVAGRAHPDALRQGGFAHLALADPKLAPYGVAAEETVARLGLSARLAPRFVRGENIAQTYQFVRSGNAELGFVSLSQVFKDGRLVQGSAWIVPEAMHAPIRQDAAMLPHGRDNPDAAALLRFLKTDPARAVIGSYGYALP